ncbi:TonB-dependent receptor-like protein, partial [mine drainage metagenome]
DQQFVDVRPNGSQPLSHIPLSEIYGGELDIAARPIERLTLHVSLAGLHTQILQGTLAGGTINIDGKRLPYAPNFRGVFSVDWEALSWPKWVLMLHVSDTYQTLMYEENLNQNFLAQPAFSLLSAQASLDSSNGRWQLQLWGTNLGNSLYFTNEVNLESLGYNYRHVGEPRMYGGDVTYRF